MSPVPSLAREFDETISTANRVDAAVLTRLATLGRETGTDLLNDVIDLFVDNAAAYHTAFDEDLERQDRAHLKQLAHRLRGSAYNLGACRLAELCHALENEAETAEMPDLALHIVSLKREIDFVSVVLRRDWRTPRHWQQESDEPLWR